MRRFGLLLLVLAAAAGFATPSYAYLNPATSTGTEFGLSPLGPGLWELTISTNGNADAGGQIGFTNTAAFNPNPAVCDAAASVVICGPVAGSDVDPAFDGNLYLIIAVAAAGALNNSATNEIVLGSLQQGAGPLAPEGTLAGLGVLTGTGVDETGFPGPVTYYRVPEPTAVAFLGLGFASLAFLRRRAA